MNLRFSDTCSMTNDVRLLLLRKKDPIVTHLTRAYGVRIDLGPGCNLIATIKGDDWRMVASCKKKIQSYMTDELPVPRLAFELLPGRRGANVSRLKESSGCNISRFPSTKLQPTCLVRVTRPPAGILKCKAVIEKLCLAEEEPFEMAREDYRTIVGHGGELVEQLQERLSILIETPHGRSSPTIRGVIKGLPRDISECKKYFEAIEREGFTGEKAQFPADNVLTKQSTKDC